VIMATISASVRAMWRARCRSATGQRRRRSGPETRARSSGDGGVHRWRVLREPGTGRMGVGCTAGPYASGARARTTNQRMEIMAVLEAAKALDGPVEVVSDSTYVINCFRDRWWEGWLQKNWINSQKRPVVNRDLWEPLIEIVRQRGITFRWVKGHSGDPMNELVDQLAGEAGRTQQGRQGVAPELDHRKLRRNESSGWPSRRR
jgi:ribonuclease HI